MLNELGIIMKVLVSDKLAQEGIDKLEQTEGLSVDVQTGMSPDELKQKIKGYDAIIIRSATKLTSDILEEADQLKYVGRAGVGLDNVDLKTATKRGVVAMNTPAGNTTSTAEHTMSMIMALSRNIPQACASMKAGRWDRSKFSGVELYGKTLGVVGLGRIGSTVAKFAHAFGMNVIAFDPFLSKEAAEARGVTALALNDVIQQADYITLHIPKTEETKNLLGQEQFAMMKDGVRVINCARGGIVDEAALAEALTSGKVAGAALDVFDAEPLDPNSPLIPLDNCILTPHLGASTSEAQINVAIEIAETISNALTGKGIMNAANFPSMDAESLKVLDPYVNLAARMGMFSGQLIHGAIKKVNITYTGVFKDYKVAPVTLSLINGLLKPMLGDSINCINALEVAKERAIDVAEIKSSKQEEYVNCIKVEIETDKDPFVIWGALSGNQEPRIVKINDIYMEAVPDGEMLFIQNTDKPGLVGSLGTILAEANINIAQITLGRVDKSQTAISVVNVDSEVPQETIEKLRNTEHVLYVKLLKV